MLGVITNPNSTTLDLVSALFSSLMVIFLCMPFRDFVCAWIATKLGDYTPKYNGRLTINPLSHIDPLGAACMIIFGIGFGKGLPYDPYNFKNSRRGVLIISIAGPLSLLVFGLLFYTLSELIVLFALSEVTLFIYTVLYTIAQINVTLAVFHLIPIPPLDGGRILFHFLPQSVNDFVRPYERYFPFLITLLIVTDVLDYPIIYASQYILKFFDLITFWI